MLADPAFIIDSNIFTPQHAQALLSKFDQDTLKNFRNKRYDNLLHITVRALVSSKNKDTSFDYLNYNALQEKYKTLFRFLVDNGVKLDELNDDNEAPIFIAYRDRDKASDITSDFLAEELGADVNYFSLEPEIRASKKLLKRLFCCGRR